MKLLFFISSMQSGGAERVMSILCNSLVKRGYEVYLATDNRKTFAYRLQPEVQIVALYPENYEDDIRFIRLVALYTSIRKIAKEIKPDVIISFMFVLNAKVLLATRGLGIPVIVSERTTLNIRQSWIDKIRRLYITRLADCLTVQTLYDYCYLGKRLPQKTVMPNPLDFPLRYDRSLKNRTILTVGSVNRWEDKGFGELIRVWGQLSKKYPEWSLQIAGTGNEVNFQSLRAIIEECQVQNSVQLLGFCQNVSDLMFRSAVFILASRQEGMPNCLLEAMSQGCACVSFDCVAGPSEIITHNKSGILVENQNFEKLSEALSRILGDENLQHEMATNALEEVKRFTVPEIIPRWEKLFMKVLN